MHLAFSITCLVVGITCLVAGAFVVANARLITAVRSSAAMALGGALVLHGFVSAGLAVAPRLRFLDRETVMGVATSVDLVAALLLAVVLVHVPAAARTLREALGLSAAGAREYERARREYRQLMRHRIANPLTVVRGGAQLLIARDDLPAAERDSLLRAIVAAADQLDAMSTDPRPRGAEELVLDGVPRLGQARDLAAVA